MTTSTISKSDAPGGQTLENLMLRVAQDARPTERLTVSEAAERYIYIHQPGSYTGMFDPQYTPYMIEPTDTLASREFTGLIFCGPIQSGKSQMIQSWLGYGLKIEPADTMIIQMTQSAAADFAISRLDRFHRNNLSFKRMLLSGSESDSMFRKQYTNGMIVTTTWPSPTELASKSIPRIFLTDYDRMEQDIGGEGSPYDLAEKRTTTFRRNAMCVAESSPSFPVTNPRWSPSADRPHEAPPTEGILGLYNRGDRRRWMWRCEDCGMGFEPDFDLLRWPDGADNMTAAEGCWLECPHCAHKYIHDEKNRLNAAGRWLREGQTMLSDGRIIGTPVRSRYASFWLKGPAARFMTWEKMVLDYLNAMDQFKRTGDETALQAVVNTQHAKPYRPQRQAALRLPEELKAKARDLGNRVVPEDVRFLVACVDVQKSRFVVQVHGFAPGNDIYIVDRFNVRASKRPNPDPAVGGLDFVRPGVNPEDWNELIEHVLTKSYPLADESGREMKIRLTMCDSGGADAATANAYAFWRRLRRPPKEKDPRRPETLCDFPTGYHQRFQLLVGRPHTGAPRYQITYPDTQRRLGAVANAAGEIPVARLNSNILKDQLDQALSRTEPRGGRINFPLWLSTEFYEELTAETRDPAGKWEKIGNARNESWDLLSYALAAGLDSRLGIERPDFWTAPPPWAAEWDKNDFIFTPDPAMKGPTPTAPKRRRSLSDMGKDFA